MMHTKRLLQWTAGLLLAAAPALAFAQTGPGGVGDASSLKLWLRADAGVYTDAGVTLATDNQPVQEWHDQSSQGSKFRQTTPASRPTYKTSFVNGYPAIQLDGVDDFIGTSINGGDLSEDFTVFIIGRFGNLNQPANDWDFMICVGGGYVGTNKSFSISRTPGNYPGGANRYFTYDGGGYKFGQTVEGQKWSVFSEKYFTALPRHKAWADGTQSTVSGASGTLQTNGLFEIGRYTSGNNQHFKGEVAEVIVYDYALNDAERIAVQNYLASKYDLTVVDDKYAYESTHRNDLIGIGRSSLNNNHIATQGAGLLTLAQDEELLDGDFVFVANNDNPLTFSGTDTPNSMGSYAERMSRTWRADVSGTPRLVSLSFDLSGVSVPNPEAIEVLIDADGTFANGASRHGTGRVWDASNQTLTFSDVPLTQGDHFTLMLGNLQVAVAHNLMLPNDLEGTATLTIDGGREPYVVLWDDATFPSASEFDAQKVENGLSGISYQEYVRNYSQFANAHLSSGAHTVTVIDSVLDTVALDFFIEHELNYAFNGVVERPDNAIRKENPTSWGNGQATLYSAFNSSETGAVFFSISQTNAQLAVGLRDAASSASVNYNDMEYGFWVNNGNFQVWGDGALGTSTAYTTSDEFAIRFEANNKVRLERNGNLIQEYTLGANEAYLFETSIRQNLAGIKEIKTDRGFRPSVELISTYASCEPPYTGAVNLEFWAPFEIFGAITYEWYNQVGDLIATTEDVQNLDPGTYSVVVSYTGPNSALINAAYVVDLYNQVNWTNFVNTTTVVGATNTLKKNGTNNAWDGDAESQNILKTGENGYFEFTSNFSGTNFRAKVGFSTTAATGNNLSSIETGFDFFSFGSTRQVGITLPFSGVGFPITYTYPRNPGDQYRLERSGNFLHYKINGITVRTFNITTFPSLAGDVMIEAAIFTPDREIETTIATFGCDAAKPIADLKTDLDGSYYLASDRIVRFRYFEDYHDPDGQLTFRVFNDFNEDVTPTGLTLNNQWGDNRNALNLQPYGALAAGFYILQVTNDKGENYYLRFKI